MEIRTCEQYVLAEIEKKNAKIDRLNEEIIRLENISYQQNITINELGNKAEELKGVLNELLELIQDKVIGEHNYYELSISDYDFEIDKFDFINELKKERESDSEE